MWLTGGTYHEWAVFLDRWTAGDAAGIDDLPRVDPSELNAETLVRLTDRIFSALATRLQTWADRMTRAMAAESDEFSVGRALTQARQGLQAIRVLAAHPALPDDLRRQLSDLIDRQIEAAQDSLETDLSRLTSSGVPRRVVEARRRTIRDNRLTAVLADPGSGITTATTAETAAGTTAGTTMAAGGADWLGDPTAPRRRRVILD
ncbi:MAG TPA: hypothetical protein VLL08_33280 [Kineosporiaceae bacterium]|nr:hypothetical protein [Kineosporiaceae bacterium]